MADDSNIDYFFIPETNPSVIGVNALDTIMSLGSQVNKITLGTGIINVFSRTQEEICRLSEEIYLKTNRKFVLGLGTSAPAIIEKMYNLKFEKPVTRLKKYTKYLKAKYQGHIFWSAVGDKVTELAAQYADGVIFFLKPEKEIEKSIRIIKEKLSQLGKPLDSFEIINIRPTFMSSTEQKAKKAAQMTVASYVGANEFYSKQLEKSGFENEVLRISQNFKSGDLHAASEQVSNEMIQELTTFGTVTDCKAKLNQYYENAKVKTVIAGFDLPKDEYNEKFFNYLSELISNR